MSSKNGSEPTGAPIKPVMMRIGEAEYPLRYTGRTLLALEDMGLSPDQFYADVKACVPKRRRREKRSRQYGKGVDGV